MIISMSALGIQRIFSLDLAELLYNMPSCIVTRWPPLARIL